MQSIGLIFIASAFLAITETRVTFPFSEVLQTQDLKSYYEGPNRLYKAAFKCDDGCTVYSDLSSDQIAIAQNDVVIANFTDFVGDLSIALDGFHLWAGVNYTLRSYVNNEDFVVYAVSSKAPNYNTPVYSSEGTISVDDTNRYITVISSYDATQFDQFNGSFPDRSGYPKIYAIGFDSLDDLYGSTKCRSMYEARSQYFAENSAPKIFAPITTVDFGFAGTHSVSISPSDGTSYSKSPISSVVYMSPGYVGCPFESDQVYSTRVSYVSDSFMIITDSLDISASYYSVASNEAVQLTVNEDYLSFYNFNTTSFSKHYDAGVYNVHLSWNRRTTFSGWFLQLDLGRLGEPAPSTVATIPPSTTTKSGRAITIPLSFIAILLFASTH
ncbi:hypothetical protein PRIPAC_78759 [Pristionchus pacificus]|uniref:Uncharacterized protein n=1 Tax=Pristionchus pacificus TaxID=54126 RepID=A0A454XZJ9_PRIPA|nr:hypothetical protein PRIPAC_78759 [Pristionchus pacificus]|eukprot:PDM72109.1 hypothetical protein PRIPAC_38543 [Pristionchus pacificus]